MNADELKCAFDTQQRREPFAFLYEILFTILQRAIITERYNPGDILKDGEIAALLGVSRTPVSRALELLKGKGCSLPVKRAVTWWRRWVPLPCGKLWIFGPV